jgi:hypothetical protein
MLFPGVTVAQEFSQAALLQQFLDCCRVNKPLKSNLTLGWVDEFCSGRPPPYYGPAPL